MVETKKIHDVIGNGSSLRVIEIDPQADPRWEAFLANVPASPSPFYHPALLKIHEEAFESKPIHLGCEDTLGHLVGILPLFYRQGRRRGRNITSVFTGPLANDDHIRAALVQAAIERTRTIGGTRLSLGVMSNAIDGLLDGVKGVPAYETYMLSLPEHPDLLRLDASIKRAVNKATKLGVEVRHAQNERELRTWYDLYVQAIRKFVVLPIPYHYFVLAWQRLHSKGMLRLLLAERIEGGQKKLLGGILLLLYGKTISFGYSGWRQEDQALRPNDILHWQAIKDGCADGFSWYDLGDVDFGNQGLAKFKGKWGAEVKIAYDYSYPVLQNMMSSEQEFSSQHSLRLVHAVWPHLPIKAIKLLSDWYYKLHF